MGARPDFSLRDRPLVRRPPRSQLGFVGSDVQPGGVTDTAPPEGPRQGHRPADAHLGGGRHDVDQHAVAESVGAAVGVDQVGVVKHGSSLGGGESQRKGCFFPVPLRPSAPALQVAFGLEHPQGERVLAPAVESAARTVAAVVRQVVGARGQAHVVEVAGRLATPVQLGQAERLALRDVEALERVGRRFDRALVPARRVDGE